MLIRYAGIAAVATILCCLVFAQARTPESPGKPTGYQLAPAQITMNVKGVTWEDHRVFLVDSSSGRVWEYVPARLDNEGKIRDSIFVGVTVAP